MYITGLVKQEKKKIAQVSSTAAEDRLYNYTAQKNYKMKLLEKTFY